MKRILLTFLAIFYLGIPQGATVYFHYCMGELVQLGMTDSKKSTCEFCGMTQKESEEESCCKDEVKQTKVDNSQKTALVHYQFEQTPVIIPKNIIWHANAVQIPLELNKTSLSNAPPLRQHVPVFIRNCTYRI